MTDEKLKALLNQIGIKNYFNAVKKLQEEYCLDDREIEQLVSHDYSFVAAKFAYFKKSWINAYNQTKNRTSNQLENKLSIDEISSCGELEKKLCDYLVFKAKTSSSVINIEATFFKLESKAVIKYAVGFWSEEIILKTFVTE